MSTGSCEPWKRPPHIGVHFDVTNGTAIGWTCTAGNYIPCEPHQPVVCWRTSHEHQPHTPGATLSRQCATSYSSTEQYSRLEYWLSIIYFIPLECTSHSIQSASQLPVWSWEECGRNSVGSPAVPEWRHWDQPRACWWVSNLVVTSPNQWLSGHSKILIVSDHIKILQVKLWGLHSYFIKLSNLILDTLWTVV